MDPTAAWQLVAAARVATLATLAEDGTAHLVPCVFAAATTGAVFTPVDTKPKRTRALQRLRDVEHDPRVTLLVHHWDEDWTRLWWVRVAGRARVLDAGAELDAARLLLVAKYAQYRDVDELDPVIAIDVGSVRGWNAVDAS